MAFIDVWQASIAASLAEFAELVTDPQDVTLALAAAAVLWPIRESIRAHDGDAYDTLRSIVPEQAGLLLKSVASWEGDRLGLSQQLAQKAANNPDLREALSQLVTFFKAIPLLTERLVLRLAPQNAATTYNISGAIQAALANFGGITTIGQLTLVSRSEAEELEDFTVKSLTAYLLELFADERKIPNDPYKFLHPFELKDKSIFFGRDKTVKTLIERIFKARLTVVHGPSGAGKSSLLRAGVGAHLLADEYLPIFARTYEKPVEAIVDQIAKYGPQPQRHLVSRLSLREYLRSVSAHMRRLPTLLERTKEIIVFLDQFEELFTLTSSAERAKTLDALIECVEDNSLPLRLVLAIRGEYFYKLAAFESRLPSIIKNQFLLEPMAAEEISQALTKPLRKVDPSMTYDADLLKELISVLTTDKMDLPELQILCNSLYNRAKAGVHSHITLAMYKAADESLGILSGYMEEALARFSAHELPTARKTMEVLVGSDGQRLIVAEADIVQQTRKDAQQIESVLARLLDARLLRRGDDGRYELSHDYVARAILKRVTPTELKMKRVREELRRSEDNWRSDQLLIPEERLLWFHQQRESLAELDNDATICLLLSSIWYNIGVDDWIDQASETVVQQIIALLANEQSRVRQYAARALGRLGHPEARQELRAALEQFGDLETKLEVTQALRRLGDAGVNTLLSVLDTATDRITWRTVVEVFCQEPDPLAVALLLRTFEVETDREYIILLAQALKMHKDVQAIPSLVQALLREKDSEVQDELVQAIKSLHDSARTDEELRLRQLIGAVSQRRAYLNAEFAAYGELDVPPEISIELDDSHAKLQQYGEHLDNILGPRRVLEESRTQVRLISTIGLEKARQIIDGVEWPYVLNAMLSFSIGDWNSELKHDCITVLSDIYEQVWEQRDRLQDLQRAVRAAEFERAKKGMNISERVFQELTTAKDRIRNLQDKTQPIDDALSAAESQLAKGLIYALQHELKPEPRVAMTKVLGMMGVEGLMSLTAALRGVDAQTQDNLKTALSELVRRYVSLLHELQRQRKHLKQLREVYLHSLEYLRQKQAIFIYMNPQVFEAALHTMPWAIAEIDSRLPLVEYEVHRREEQLVLPLIELLQASEAQPLQQIAIVAIGWLGPSDALTALEEFLQVKPLATDMLLTSWMQCEEDRLQNRVSLSALLDAWPMRQRVQQMDINNRYLESTRSCQCIAGVLEWIWSRPEQLQRIESEVRHALQTLAAAPDKQTSVAAWTVETLWKRCLQPMRRLRMMSSITNELLSILDYEFESLGNPQGDTIDHLLDQIETEAAEVLIATIQRSNDIETQQSIIATLSCLDPSMANILAVAFQQTTEQHKRQLLSKAVQQNITSLRDLSEILYSGREHFSMLFQDFRYILHYRQRQIATLGNKAAIEWLVDQGMVAEAMSRAKSQCQRLSEAIASIERAIHTLEVATDVESTKGVEAEFSCDSLPTIRNSVWVPISDSAVILRELLTSTRRRLHQQEQRAAFSGINTPPGVSFDIDRARAEIELISQRLRELEVDAG